MKKCSLLGCGGSRLRVGIGDIRIPSRILNQPRENVESPFPNGTPGQPRELLIRYEAQLLPVVGGDNSQVEGLGKDPAIIDQLLWYGTVVE